MNKKRLLIFPAIFLLSLFFIGNTAVKADEKKSSIAAYWNFDGQSGDLKKIIDQSPSANTGINYGAKTVGGISGQALYFDGRNDYIEVPNNPSLNFNTGDFTISAWIKTTASTVGWDQARDDIVAKGMAFSSGYGLSLLHNRPAAHWGNTGRVGFAAKSKSLNDGQWHNLVASRNNGQVKIYADGQLKLEYSSWGNLDVENNLFIGQHGPRNESYFEGKIDEVKILNYAIEEKDVLRSYNEVLAEYDPAIEEKIDQANNFDAKKEFEKSAVKNVMEYTIKEGDTLDSITVNLCGSTRFLDTIFSLDDFKKENGQPVLNVGDKLKLSTDLCDPSNHYNQDPRYGFKELNENIKYHFVSAGETLWGIAEKECGQGYLWNKLFNPELFSRKDNGNILIKEGDELTINYSSCQKYNAIENSPSVGNEDEKSHIVSAGETLWGIAEKECGQGYLWNKLFNPELFSRKDNGNILIKEGDELTINYSSCHK